MKTITGLAVALLMVTVAAPAWAQSPSGEGAESGDSPGATRQIAQALSARGYIAGPVDGDWDAKMQQALVQFQRAQGLPATGRADAKTLSALGIDPGQADQAALSR